MTTFARKYGYEDAYGDQQISHTNIYNADQHSVFAGRSPNPYVTFVAGGAFSTWKIQNGSVNLYIEEGRNRDVPRADGTIPTRIYPSIELICALKVIQSEFADLQRRGELSAGIIEISSLVRGFNINNIKDQSLHRIGYAVDFSGTPIKSICNYTESTRKSLKEKLDSIILKIKRTYPYIKNPLFIVETDGSVTRALPNKPVRIIHFQCNPQPDHPLANPLSSLSPGERTSPFTGPAVAPFFDDEMPPSEIVEDPPKLIVKPYTGTIELEDSLPSQVEAANKDGAFRVGDVWLSVPPEKIRFQVSNNVIELPAIRAAGNPKIPSGINLSEIEIDLVFVGDAINIEFRPILAMVYRTPFITIQNAFLRNIIQRNMDLVATRIASVSRTKPENLTQEAFENKFKFVMSALYGKFDRPEAKRLALAYALYDSQFTDIVNRIATVLPTETMKALLPNINAENLPKDESKQAFIDQVIRAFDSRNMSPQDFKRLLNQTPSMSEEFQTRTAEDVLNELEITIGADVTIPDTSEDLDALRIAVETASDMSKVASNDDPIPVVLKGLSISTIPDIVDTIRVTLRMGMFNQLLYNPSLLFCKKLSGVRELIDAIDAKMPIPGSNIEVTNDISECEPFVLYYSRELCVDPKKPKVNGVTREVPPPHRPNFSPDSNVNFVDSPRDKPSIQYFESLDKFAISSKMIDRSFEDNLAEEITRSENQLITQERLAKEMIPDVIGRGTGAREVENPSTANILFWVERVKQNIAAYMHVVSSFENPNTIAHIANTAASYFSDHPFRNPQTVEGMKEHIANLSTIVTTPNGNMFLNESQILSLNELCKTIFGATTQELLAANLPEAKRNRDRKFEKAINALAAAREYAELLQKNYSIVAALADSQYRSITNDKSYYNSLADKPGHDNIWFNNKPVEYNATLTSVHGFLSNKITEIPMKQYKIPAHQHFGKGDWKLQLTFISDSEEFIREMKAMSARANSIQRMQSLFIKNPRLMTDPALIIDCDILNMLGAHKFVVETINHETVENSPGWYRVTIDISQADLRAQKTETLERAAALGGHPAIQVMAAMIDLVFFDSTCQLLVGLEASSTASLQSYMMEKIRDKRAGDLIKVHSVSDLSPYTGQGIESFVHEYGTIKNNFGTSLLIPIRDFEATANQIINFTRPRSNANINDITSNLNVTNYVSSVRNYEKFSVPMPFLFTASTSPTSSVPLSSAGVMMSIGTIRHLSPALHTLPIGTYRNFDGISNPVFGLRHISFDFTNFFDRMFSVGNLIIAGGTAITAGVVLYFGGTALAISTLMGGGVIEWYKNIIQSVNFNSERSFLPFSVTSQEKIQGAFPNIAALTISTEGLVENSPSKLTKDFIQVYPAVKTLMQAIENAHITTINNYLRTPPQDIINSMAKTPIGLIGQIVTMPFNTLLAKILGTGVGIYNRLMSQSDVMYQSQQLIDSLVGNDFSEEKIDEFITTLENISRAIDTKIKTMRVGSDYLTSYMFEDYSGNESSRHQKVVQMGRVLRSNLMDVKTHMDSIKLNATAFLYPDLVLPVIPGMDKGLPPDFYFYVDPILNSNRINFYTDQMDKLIENKVKTAAVAALGDYEYGYNRLSRLDNPRLREKLLGNIPAIANGLFPNLSDNDTVMAMLRNPNELPRNASGRLELVTRSNMDQYAIDRLAGTVHALADLGVLLNMIQTVDDKLQGLGFPVQELHDYRIGRASRGDSPTKFGLKLPKINFMNNIHDIFTEVKDSIPKERTPIIEELIRQRNDLLRKVSGYYGNVNLLVNPAISNRSFGEYNGSVNYGGERYGLIQADTQIRMAALRKLAQQSASANYIPANLRAYPCYKIYLVEEDSPQLRAWDEYFEYTGAISINVVSDKDAASTVCEIDMANLTGIVTNELAEDGKEIVRFINNSYGGALEGHTTNTISVKPGTKIIVKMGYGASHSDLYTVFSGSIVSITPGDIVHIVAQGFGYELTSNIGTNENPEVIGMGHTVQSLGDLVTWAFNRLKGMYHFGRRGPSEKQYTDELRQSPNWLLLDWLRKSFTNLSAAEIMSNDPRDDNIYLPYSQLMILNVFGQGIWSKIKELISPGNLISHTDAITSDEYFNWTVFEETAWDLLQEITLMVRDYIVAVLPYNTDKEPWDINNNERVTVYVGPKWGYYKWTDTYDDKDIKKVREAIERSQGIYLKQSVVAQTLKDMGYNSTDNRPTIEQIYYTTLMCILHAMGSRNWEVLQTSGGNANFAYLNGNLPDVGTTKYCNIPSQVHEVDKLILDSLFVNVLAVLTYEEERQINTVASVHLGQPVTPQRIDRFRATHAIIKWITKGFAIHEHVVDVIKAMKTGTRNWPARLTSTPTAISNFVNDRLSEAKKQEIINGIVAEIDKPTQTAASEISEEIIRQILVMDNLNRIPVILPHLSGYKPVIDIHSISSFQDICDNQMIASADGINNQVTIEFPDEPPTNLGETYSYSGNDLRQWTAYVNDSIAPDAIRPYTTFAPNIDPKLGSFFGLQFGPEAADNLLETGFKKQVPDKLSKDKITEVIINSIPENFMSNLADIMSPEVINQTFEDIEVVPRFHTYATNLLCKKMEPMYDGFISILGNPKIKPHDIVFINDMMSDIYGPIVVRKVVHTMSSDEGFVTKIQPGLLTFHRNALNAANIGEIQHVKNLAFLYGLGAGIKTLASTLAVDMVFNLGHAAFAAKGAAAGILKSALVPTGFWGWGLNIGFPLISSFFSYQSAQNQQAWIGMNDIFARNSVFLVPVWKNGTPFVAGLDGFTMKDYRVHTADAIYNPYDPARALESFLPFLQTNNSIANEGGR